MRFNSKRIKYEIHLFETQFCQSISNDLQALFSTDDDYGECECEEDSADSKKINKLDDFEAQLKGDYKKFREIVGH